MLRYCLTLDLRKDAELIAEYVALHTVSRPAITKSIRDAGIVDMQLYELDGRVFMIMDTVDDFSFERKLEMDLANPQVQEWEALVAKFQDVGSESDFGAKWRLMRKIFQLSPE